MRRARVAIEPIGLAHGHGAHHRIRNGCSNRFYRTCQPRHAMPGNLKAEYRISEDDYVRVARFNAWRDLVGRPAQIAAAGAIMMMLALAAWMLPEAGLSLARTAAVIAILFAAVLIVRLPFQARRLYRQHKAIQGAITIELNDQGIRFGSADGSTKVAWPSIFKWRQNQQFIVVYKMPSLFHIVPKSIARDGFDLARLVDRLAAHVGRAR